MGTIRIHNSEAVPCEDDKLLNESIRQARHQTPGNTSAEIYCTPRKQNGWLEFGLRLSYSDGSSFYIGCIQRSPGAECEFHS